MKERDYSIDIIKFLAVFLIINSHSDIAYPKYPFLATGGAIGDALFLFCSGYTLLLGKMHGFPNYYKRRINRIYPSSVGCLIIMMALPWCSNDLNLLFRLSFGRVFLNAIMIYYILLWLIRKFFANHIIYLFYITAVVSIVVYVFFFPYKYETGSKGLYGITSLYRWIPYFGIMLLGAYVGGNRSKLIYSLKKDSCKFFICLFLFYGIQMLGKRYHEIAPLQIITLIFLVGLVFYLYKICNTPFFKRIYENKRGNAVIMIVGGLCLESYLIQYSVITDKLNFLFPLNILIIIVGVLVMAYICRCIARLFSQTLKQEDYEWNKIFSLK